MTQENSNSYANTTPKEVLDTEKTGQAPKNVNSVPNDASASSKVEAQPGSRESSSGSESSSPGGSSAVEVKDVLNTEKTGKAPENVNNVPN